MPGTNKTSWVSWVSTPMPSPRAKPSAEVSKVLQLPSMARPRIFAKPTWIVQRSVSLLKFFESLENPPGDLSDIGDLIWSLVDVIRFPSITPKWRLKAASWHHWLQQICLASTQYQKGRSQIEANIVFKFKLLSSWQRPKRIAWLAQSKATTWKQNNMDGLVILAHTCNIFLYLVKCLFWSFLQVQKSLQISAKSNSPTMIQVSKSRHGCTALMNWGTHRCRARRVHCEARSPQRQGVRHSTRQAGVGIASGHFHTHHFTPFQCISAHLLSSPTDVGKWAKGWDIWFNATQSSATNVDTTIQAIHGLFRQA